MTAMMKYDFVIVGGGTSGCVLASRLCQALPDKTFALLERGTQRTDTQELYVRAPRLSGSDETLRDFWFSEPNPAIGFTSMLIQGKTLGGTSAQSTSLWVVPPDLSIFDDWGISGLDHSSAALYYDKAVKTLGFATNVAPNASLIPEYMGDWLTAAAAAGINVVSPTVKASADDDEQHYTAPIQDAHGVRIDASRAYIYPLLQRGLCPNLSILQGATATKILINKKKVATGVVYVNSTDTNLTAPMTITAREEVILSAGPYLSPKLLQLSGIGPAELLKANNISVVANLPVGKSTYTRAIGQVVSTYLGAQYGGRPLAAANNLTAIQADETLLQFTSGQGGVLGMTPMPVTGTISGGVSEVSSGPPINPQLINQPIILMICSPPPSMGSVEIADTDPFSFPKVELNLLSTEAEIDQIVDCAQKYQSVFSKFPADFPMIPAYPSFTGNATALREYFLTSPLGIGNSYDIVAGCPVGKVLDKKFKVLGVKNLRVIDASSHPEMPTLSRPMSTVYMLAELASDSIIAQYAKNTKKGRPKKSMNVGPKLHLRHLGSKE